MFDLSCRRLYPKGYRKYLVLMRGCKLHAPDYRSTGVGFALPIKYTTFGHTRCHRTSECSSSAKKFSIVTMGHFRGYLFFLQCSYQNAIHGILIVYHSYMCCSLVGEEFTTPTLTPYEAMVALGAVQPWWQGPDNLNRSMNPYPMDYYAKDGGPWNSSYHKKKLRNTQSQANPSTEEQPE